MGAQPRTRFLPNHRRMLLVGLACAFCLYAAIPQVVGFVDRGMNGYFGWRLAPDGAIRFVWPNSAAQRAGLRAHDRILFERISFDRIYRLGPFGQPSGYATTIDVQQANVIRHVTLKTQERPTTAQNLLAEFLLVAQSLLFLAIGLFVLLRRPDRIGVAFFGFCSTAPITGYIVRFYSFVPDPFGTALFAFTYFWFASPVIALMFMVFALYFPDGLNIAKRRLLPLVWLVTLITLAEAAYETSFQLRASAVLTPWTFVIDQLPLATALALLICGYLGSNTVQRTRLVWAIVALAYDALVLFANPLGIANPWIVECLHASTIIVPLLLAYAILHDHVFDISFTLNRAIVYGVLTAALAFIIGVLDWAAERFVGSRNFALAAEAIVAVGFGIVADELRGRLSHGMERIVFRERHLTERRMERIAASLHAAGSVDAVSHAVVDDVVQVMSIASAAFFVRQNNGPYNRVRAFGWDRSTCTELTVADGVVRTLVLGLQPVRTADIALRCDGMVGSAVPALAVPMVARNELIGVLLYGRHVNGLSIDPGEIRLLQDVARTGTSALDAVEMYALRRALEDARRELRALHSAPT